MKKIIFFSMLFLMLMGVHAYAEESYLVWLDDSVQLFSAESRAEGDGFYTVDRETLFECLEAGIVEKYIPNAAVRLCDTDWNQAAIKAAFPQSVGCGGANVTVAVIDSGVQEIGILEGRVLAGKNYLDGSANVNDTVGHGTFVSGIIAAGANQCNILPLKCFDDSVGTLGHVLDAIHDAVVTYEVDVINLSLSLIETDYTEEVLAEIRGFLNQYVYNASTLGCLVIASAGNEGTDAVSYPAGCAEAIGVGAVDQDNVWCSFSQYNESVLVVAPGQGVVSTAIEGYQKNSGTSFAAPHVSALAAIAKSMKPSITTAEFKAVLMETSVDLGAPGRDDYYGYGLIDCEAATKKLMEENTVYISPIAQDKNSVAAVFYNNSDSDVEVSCIYTCYDGKGGLLTAPFIHTETIGAGKAFTYEKPYASGYACFMAWKNLSDLKPLGANRIQ